MMKNSNLNIGIAGAGLMGRLLAFALINLGCKVSLFDKDPLAEQASCSMAAAGLIAPIAELANADPKIFHLGEESLLEWPNILRQLDPGIYFRQIGILITAHPQDKNDLEIYLQKIRQKLTQFNIQTTDTTALSKEKILSLEPELTNFSSGYLFSQDGQIDNQYFLAALHQYLLAQGCIWQENTFVENVAPKKIYLADGEKSFDLVFDCRGVGAKKTFPGLRGIRGELVWLHAPHVKLQRPVKLIHPRYSLYIVPRPNQNYIVGASEIESEDKSPISVRTTLELLSAAYSLHAGFIEASLIKTVVECRPALPNQLPQINYQEGLIAINGLYRHGYLLAPALAKQVTKHLQQNYL